MSRFFYFYEDRNGFDNFHHKAQYLTTAFMPLLFLVLMLISYFSTPIAVLCVAAVAAMYLTGLFRSIIPTLRKRTGVISPLLVSSAAGPLYLAVLFLTNPSLFGPLGLFLIFAVPAILLAPLIIELFRNGEVVVEEVYDEEQSTEELEKVS